MGEAMKERVRYPHYRLPHKLKVREGKERPRLLSFFEKLELDLGWSASEDHPYEGGYVPFTPGGSCLMHLEAATEDEAWQNLLEDASHMPYQGKQGFYERGYRVERLNLI
jgi:hypothetical protein